jgi:hypothetical protein
VRGTAVIALEEVFDRQLPVRLDRIEAPGANFEPGEAVLAGHVAEVLQLGVEAGRLLGARQIDEDVPLDDLDVTRYEAVHGRIEITRHPVRLDQLPIQVVGPPVIRAAEQGRVAARAQLADRETGIPRPRVVAVPAESRAAMTADVVKRLDGSLVVPDEDDVLAPAELEHEVVAGFGDATDVIDHQPQAVRDVTLVLHVAPRIEVVLRRDGGSLAPVGCALPGDRVPSRRVRRHSTRTARDGGPHHVRHDDPGRTGRQSRLREVPAVHLSLRAHEVLPLHDRALGKLLQLGLFRDHELSHKSRLMPAAGRS